MNSVDLGRPGADGVVLEAQGSLEATVDMNDVSSDRHAQIGCSV